LDPETVSSYRPISNLPYISKVIERVVARRFSSHLSHHSLLPARQSAYREYRPFYSTETAVLSVHNDVVRSIDNGQVSLLMLLDLSAAFDTVDHQILLSVLSDRFAVANNALACFTSYLTDRTQQFMYAGSCTSSFTVDCSVPQRSVLGPLKFVAYTEDIVQLADEHDTLSHLYMTHNCTPAVDLKIATSSEHVFRTASLMSHCGALLVVFSLTLKRLKRFGLGRAEM